MHLNCHILANRVLDFPSTAILFWFYSAAYELWIVDHVSKGKDIVCLSRHLCCYAVCECFFSYFVIYFGLSAVFRLRSYMSIALWIEYAYHVSALSARPIDSRVSMCLCVPEATNQHTIRTIWRWYHRRRHNTRTHAHTHTHHPPLEREIRVGQECQTHSDYIYIEAAANNLRVHVSEKSAHHTTSIRNTHFVTYCVFSRRLFLLSESIVIFAVLLVCVLFFSLMYRHGYSSAFLIEFFNFSIFQSQYLWFHAQVSFWHWVMQICQLISSMSWLPKFNFRNKLCINSSSLMFDISNYNWMSFRKLFTISCNENELFQYKSTINDTTINLFEINKVFKLRAQAHVIWLSHQLYSVINSQNAKRVKNVWFFCCHNLWRTSC